MSVTTRNPLRMVGATLHSGGVNTAEEQGTLGGSMRATIFSGMPSGAGAGGVAPATGAMVNGVNTAGGADTLIYAGAGRLKDVLLHASYPSLSGITLQFYDAGGAVTSGGPFAASGHAVVASIPGPYGVSGQQAVQIGPIGFDVPFNSGLAVHVTSGHPGFTVTFTPEVNPAIG